MGEYILVIISSRHWVCNCLLLVVNAVYNVQWLAQVVTSRRPPKGRSVHTDLPDKRLKMKLLLLVSLSCLATAAWARPGSTYTNKFDQINVDEILESQRLLRGYVDCLLDKGRCTPDAKVLKETLPDALEHECSKCTKKQKEGADKVISFLVNQRPALYEELSGKYDPENIFQERYKDKISAAKNKP